MGEVGAQYFIVCRAGLYLNGPACFAGDPLLLLPTDPAPV